MYIKKLKVKNYRSLKDVEIGELTPVTVLFGNNDTGKSNILSFLELLFSIKTSNEILQPDPVTKETPPQRPGVFWRGLINNFEDNFYKNEPDPIEFSVQVYLSRQETDSLPGVSANFLKTLKQDRDEDHVILEGRIVAATGKTAEILLDSVSFNKVAFFHQNEKDGLVYLQGFEIPENERIDTFNSVMGALEQCFKRVPPDRFLGMETEDLDRNSDVPLSSSTFKNWLFRASLDRGKENVFKTIGDGFSAEPFQYGRLTIARQGTNEIEILIENSELKLPIGRKGSGVQQILMILGHIAESRASIIGIEEIEINLSPASQQDVFETLSQLVNLPESRISQIILTSHSRHIARRKDASSNYVSIKDGQTIVKKASKANMDEFFEAP